MTSPDREAAPQDPVPPEDPVHAAPQQESAAEAGSPPASGEPTPAPQEPAGPTAEQQLAERTADLQRLQAEYLNYKRRVDRDRELIRTNAIGSVVSAILPVLDDIGRAHEHNELHGGFKAVSDSLVRALESFGLEPFGQEGEPFDPNVHEAMMHGYSDDVTETVTEKVLQVGYRMGDKILRPARVSVLDPSEETPESSAETGPDGQAGEPAERETGGQPDQS